MSRGKVEKNHIVSVSNNILRNIEIDGEKSYNTLTRIKNFEKKNDGKSQVNLIHGSSVWADTVPDPREDVMRRKGWYYQNRGLGQKMNLYFFDGANETFTLGEVKYLYCKMFIDSWSNNSQNLPFFHIYTKPTGVNDAGAFYHSKVDYTMTQNTPKIGLGEECFFFAESVPEDNEKWFENRTIQMVDKILNGDCADDEEILFLALGTDSSAMPFLVNIGVQELGFSMGEYKRKMELIGFINDDVLHHDHILKDYNLPSGTNTLTESIRIDTTHGNISWWVQSNGVVLSNQIGVEIQVSHDGSTYETIALNSKFVDVEDGTYSRFGNIKDFKPTFVRIRVTNNDNLQGDNFNVYISY